MAKSLLAHLYSRIRGSQEDVATLSLQYLISQSSELNRAFTRLIASSLEVQIDTPLQYVCQLVGNDKECPDMAGLDPSGNEIILCEMKFYAGLTQNQPLSYLKRLKDKNGIGLVFICPKARQTNLWSKLTDLCKESTLEIISPHCLSVDGVHMSIITWAEILDLLQRTASASAEEYLSDIKQLQGFCDQMDSDAFIPFAPDELTAGNAVKMQRFFTVVDETANLLCADKSITASLSGKSSAYRTGYERKLLVNGKTIYISFDREMWKSNASIETPFWLAVGNSTFQQEEQYKKAMVKIDENHRENSIWSMCYFSLEPLSDATLDEVCENLKKQILDYLALFD